MTDKRQPDTGLGYDNGPLIFMVWGVLGWGRGGVSGAGGIGNQIPLTFLTELSDLVGAR